MIPKIKKVYNLSYRWNKIGSYPNMDPYSIVFCYTIFGDSYIIKGGWQEIRLYLSNITTPTFANITYWRHGKSRNIFSFYGCNNIKLYVRRRHDIKYHKKGFKIIHNENNNKIEVIGTYRSLPKAFPNAVKEFIKNK